ncbi:hypothetical protein N7539_008809 [Penicillium diatomitis]|uniref:Uncharacterized protein n=1 Tax=Penicillium diatomitis TaxID=2819901 RepID=A0A9W9WQX7_9EURO|nr:uncharacterized protein N7539_008809 [Penicillium diatomitis]KAJ5471866.1 hypothetical protein N7539_008809 [Penicillium diatomitis]
MNFLENLSLSKDVCQFSELYNHHAGLSHPASITIAHSPVPVFSQSKPCCFNDLHYPSSFMPREYEWEITKEKWTKQSVVYLARCNKGDKSNSDNRREFQRQHLIFITWDERLSFKLLSRHERMALHDFDCA